MPNFPISKSQGALILLILVLGNESALGPIRNVVNSFDGQGFSRDLHRIVDLIDRAETFKQLAGPNPGSFLPDGMDINNLSDMAGSFMNLLSSPDK